MRCNRDSVLIVTENSFFLCDVSCCCRSRSEKERKNTQKICGLSVCVKNCEEILNFHGKFLACVGEEENSGYESSNLCLWGEFSDFLYFQARSQAHQHNQSAEFNELKVIFLLFCSAPLSGRFIIFFFSFQQSNSIASVHIFSFDSHTLAKSLFVSFFLHLFLFFIHRRSSSRVCVGKSAFFCYLLRNIFIICKCANFFL